MSSVVARKISMVSPPDWASLFEEQYRSLLRYSRMLTNNPDDAQDIVQETFRRFLEVMNRNQPEISDYGSYLRRTARNLVNDKWSKERVGDYFSLDHQGRTTLPDELVDNSSIEAIEGRVYLEELMHSLPFGIIFRNLSESDCELLYKSAALGTSMEDIATELGLDVDTIRYRVQKMLAKIRYRAKTYLEGEGKTSLFGRL